MKVKVSYGHTFNRGNYESERIDASIEMDTKPTTEDPTPEMDVIFNTVKEWVWKKGGKL